MTFKTATIPNSARAALRIPFLAVRTPLDLLDQQVVVRVFGVNSAAHRSLARGLHTLDALAAPAGSSGAGPTDARPDTSDPQPAAARAKSDIITDVEVVERDGGDQPIQAEEQEEIEQLAETFLAETDLAPLSGELAENDELRRVQAEIRAKQAVETEHGQL